MHSFYIRAELPGSASNSLSRVTRLHINRPFEGLSLQCMYTAYLKVYVSWKKYYWKNMVKEKLVCQTDSLFSIWKGYRKSNRVFTLQIYLQNYHVNITNAFIAFKWNNQNLYTTRMGSTKIFIEQVFKGLCYKTEQNYKSRYYAFGKALNIVILYITLSG